MPCIVFVEIHEVDISWSGMGFESNYAEQGIHLGIRRHSEIMGRT